MVIKFHRTHTSTVTQNELQNTSTQILKYVHAGVLSDVTGWISATKQHVELTVGIRPDVTPKRQPSVQTECKIQMMQSGQKLFGITLKCVKPINKNKSTSTLDLMTHLHNLIHIFKISFLNSHISTCCLHLEVSGDLDLK